MGGGQSILSDNQTKQRNEIINKLYLKYKLNYLLGEGGYSKVYYAINNETNNSVAVKKINLLKAIKENNLGIIETAFYELNAFKRIGNHDFIVTLHSAFRHNVCCYLVMDCLSGGDLRHFLKINGSLNEESVVYIVGCIGSALHHMHSRGVIHRDVKPENIGLDTLGRPYLTDFGISLISSVDNPIPISKSSSGTLPYLSPEVLSPGHYHSHQSDYWSLGVLAYELFFGRRPFSRLCPLNMVQFVSNEYGWIWVELKKRLDSDFHSSYYNRDEDLYLDRNNNNNNGIDNNDNIGDDDNNDNINIRKIGPMIDLECIKSNTKDDMIRFPDLNIHLNEDGSVPSCLMVPLPLPIPISSTLTSLPSSSTPEMPSSNDETSPISPACPQTPVHYTSKTISEEFRSLLNGLLDVRIPRRLGNMSRYHEFNDHDCFLKHGYFLSQLILISSPIRYQCQFMSSSFHSKLLLDSKPPPNLCVPITPEDGLLSNTMEERLIHFYYNSDEKSSQLNSNIKTPSNYSKSVESTEFSNTKFTNLSRGFRLYQ